MRFIFKAMAGNGTDYMPGEEIVEQVVQGAPSYPQAEGRFFDSLTRFYGLVEYLPEGIVTAFYANGGHVFDWTGVLVGELEVQGA